MAGPEEEFIEAVGVMVPAADGHVVTEGDECAFAGDGTQAGFAGELDGLVSGNKEGTAGRAGTAFHTEERAFVQALVEDIHRRRSRPDRLSDPVPDKEQLRRRTGKAIGKAHLPGLDIERTVLDKVGLTGGRGPAFQQKAGIPSQNHISVNPVSESAARPVFTQGMNMAFDQEESPDGLPAGIAEEFLSVPPDDRFGIRREIRVQMAADRPVHVRVGTDLVIGTGVQAQDPFLAGEKDEAAGDRAIGRIPLPVIGDGELDGGQPDGRLHPGGPPAGPVRPVEEPPRLTERVVQPERMTGGKEAAKGKGTERPPVKGGPLERRKQVPHRLFCGKLRKNPGPAEAGTGYFTTFFRLRGLISVFYHPKRIPTSMPAISGCWVRMLLDCPQGNQ